MRARLIVLAIASLALVPASAQASLVKSPYALVHGCYQLRSQPLGRTVGDQSGPYRMQATALGRYLLYGKKGDFLTAAHDGTVSPAPDPSEAGDWRVDRRGRAFTLTLPSGSVLSVRHDGALATDSPARAFTFIRASGCATYPESDTDVSGGPSRGASPWGETRGLLESHLHWMAFEMFGGKAHCGRPWSPYGVAYAMVDCPDHKPGGAGLYLENVLSGRNPAATHDTVGWPTFRDWPNATSLTHEGSYYKWVERAWRGGLRLMVNLFVDNAQLCQVWPTKVHDCNEMNTVRLEIKQLRDLQDYVDAQYGGPGKGWLRIVYDPFQARRVINQGKLAVVMGIEISRLFDCQVYDGAPLCDRSVIDRQLAEMSADGVRDFELAVKFDNALSGAAGDPGTNGAVTNNGNKLETNHYFDMQACTGPPGAADKTQTNPGPAGGPFAQAFGALGQGGALPVYPPPPHCNQRGLSDLGAYAVNRIADRGDIIDPDHMSEFGRSATLDILEARRYSGVISSHSWSTPVDEARIYKLGGVVFPKASDIGKASDSSWFVKEWKRLRRMRDPRYYFGFGFGSDMNGVAKQPIARVDASTKDPVRYPFKSFDGKQTIGQSTTGKRVWDFNKDGVAQYGLYLDWLQELRNHAGPQFVQEMLRGPEAYLQMWERASGVPAQTGLTDARVTRSGVGPVRLGASTRSLLMQAGQPLRRGWHAWRWHARGTRVVAVLSPRGRVVLAARTGSVGAPSPRGARAFGPGVRVRKAGPRVYVFGMRSGRVRYVAVASAFAAESAGRLRSYLRTAGLLH
jgi:microsomal dipeptidase-like Zn-dependent dipeptidase